MPKKQSQIQKSGKVKVPKLTKSKKTLLENTKKQYSKLGTKYILLSNKKARRERRLRNLQEVQRMDKNKIMKQEKLIEKTDNQINQIKEKLKSHPYSNDRTKEKFNECIRIFGKKKKCIEN